MIRGALLYLTMDTLIRQQADDGGGTVVGVVRLYSACPTTELNIKVGSIHARSSRPRSYDIEQHSQMWSVRGGCNRSSRGPRGTMATW